MKMNTAQLTNYQAIVDEINTVTNANRKPGQFKPQGSDLGLINLSRQWNLDLTWCFDQRTSKTSRWGFERMFEQKIPAVMTILAAFANSDGRLGDTVRYYLNHPDAVVDEIVYPKTSHQKSHGNRMQIREAIGYLVNDCNDDPSLCNPFSSASIYGKLDQICGIDQFDGAMDVPAIPTADDKYYQADLIRQTSLVLAVGLLINKYALAYQGHDINVAQWALQLA